MAYLPNIAYFMDKYKPINNKVMEEIWKEIKGFNGLYEVSNLGGVRSWKKVPSGILDKPKIKSLSTANNGYKRVRLSKESKAKHYTVHRLVAEAFLKNSDTKESVNHIDSDKTNNCVDNLEWCTFSDNMKHSYKNGRTSPFSKGESHVGSKLTKKDVIEIKKKLSEGLRTQKEISNIFNVNQSIISCINTGKYWSHIKLSEV